MTYLYQRLTAHDAVDAFRQFDRLDSNFTADEVRTLFDYYEGLAEDIGEPIELDVIAWCCDWAAYGTAWAAMLEYQPDDMPTVDLDDGCDLEEIAEAEEEAALEWLREHTTVLESGDSILVQAF